MSNNSTKKHPNQESNQAEPALELRFKFTQEQVIRALRHLLIGTTIAGTFVSGVAFGRSGLLPNSPEKPVIPQIQPRS